MIAATRLALRKTSVWVARQPRASSRRCCLLRQARCFSDDSNATGITFSREKTLHEILLQHGLVYLRPLGHGTFGRVVLARTGQAATDKLTAVKIARSTGAFTYEEAQEAEEHLAELVNFVSTLQPGYVKASLEKVTLKRLEEQVTERSPIAGEYRPFQGRMVRRAEAEQVHSAALSARLFAVNVVRR